VRTSPPSENRNASQPLACAGGWASGTWCTVHEVFHLLRRRALLAARHLSYTAGARGNYASSASPDGPGSRAGTDVWQSTAGQGSERQHVLAGDTGIGSVERTAESRCSSRPISSPQQWVCQLGRGAASEYGSRGEDSDPGRDAERLAGQGNPPGPPGKKLCCVRGSIERNAGSPYRRRWRDGRRGESAAL
jgi:hypothetical protein